MRFRLCSVVVLILMVLCTLHLGAQSTFGSISGVLSDSSGAVIPGAHIQLKNAADGTTRSLESDASGLFEFQNLKPGVYQIRVTKNGFNAIQQNNFSLEARQQRRADFALHVASEQQEVVVNSDDAAITTENANIAETLNTQEVTELPSNFRGASTSPLAAIVSAPDVQQDSQGNISLAGGSVAMADYTVDGISTTNIRNNGPNTNMFPSSEMLSEFRVSAINNNAEFGSSGDVTVTSKSGTNKLHGSAFEYGQNKVLDANTWGSPIKPRKTWNTFGASLNGPVVIPHLYDGHNRTFFFIDYEGNRHAGTTLETYTVPTSGMRQGLLSAWSNGDSIIDPATGNTYSSEGITNIPINSVSQKILDKYYHGPNEIVSANAGYGYYRTLLPLKNLTDGFDVRLDHNITPNQQLAVRWSWKNQPYQQAVSLLPSMDIQQDNRNLLVSHNYIFSSGLLNEFRFGFSNNVIERRYSLKGGDVLSELGLTDMVDTLTDSAKTYGGFPGFDFSSGSTGDFQAIGQGKVGPTHSFSLELNDNLTWVMHRHTFKFGFDIRRLNDKTVNNFAFSDDFGYFKYVGAFTGDSFADFLTGRPYLNFVATTGPNVDQSSMHYAVYAQDEYKLNNKITLTWGLRWELLPPFSEKSHNIANFNPATGDVVIPDGAPTVVDGFRYGVNDCSLNSGLTPCTNIKKASAEGMPQSLRYTYWKNFNPRVGIAWRPFGDKTAFRAGFGIYTVQSLGVVAYQMTGITSTNFVTYVNSTGAAFPTSVYSSGLTPCVETSNPDGCEDFDEGTDPHFRDPATAQYNVTVERALSSNWSGRLSYIGMNTYRLPYSEDLNQVHPSTTAFSVSEQPYQNFFQLFMLTNSAHQNYNAFEAQATHRMASGLFLQSTYTWAKNLGNSGGEAPSQLSNEGGFVNAPVGFTDRFNKRAARGNDVATRRHRLLVTSLYDLPFGKNHALLSNTNALTRAVVSNWQLSTISLLQSGSFLTPTIAASYSQANMDENNRNVVVRPDRIGNCNSHAAAGHLFNNDAFEETPSGAGRIGTSGVGVCEGPGTIAVAGGIARTFAVTGRLHARFDLTFSNILNHTNMAAPSTLYIPGASDADTSFGVSNSVQDSENAGNRSGQFSLRLEF